MDAPLPEPWAETSYASTAMILSIVGLLSCGLISPIGMVMADRELEAIEAGRRDPANERTAKIAKGIGALGTTVLTFVVLSAIAFFAIGVAYA